MPWRDFVCSPFVGQHLKGDENQVCLGYRTFVCDGGWRSLSQVPCIEVVHRLPFFESRRTLGLSCCMAIFTDKEGRASSLVRIDTALRRLGFMTVVSAAQEVANILSLRSFPHVTMGNSSYRVLHLQRYARAAYCARLLLRSFEKPMDKKSYRTSMTALWIKSSIALRPILWSSIKQPWP